MMSTKTKQLTDTQRTRLHTFMRKKQGNVKLAKELTGISENTLKRAILGANINDETLIKIKTVLPKLK